MSSGRALSETVGARPVGGIESLLDRTRTDGEPVSSLVAATAAERQSTVSPPRLPRL
jgi:hypothetical protein